MSNLTEGHLASYIGTRSDLGAQAEVLSLAGSGAWVKWVTGSRKGEITMEYQDDLAPLHNGRQQQYVASQHDELDDSLDVGVINHVGMLQVHATQGSAGVLNALHAQGRLHGLAGAAEEALSVVAHRVRQDPAIREVTAQLDEDDAEDLVQLASLSLLQNSFGVTRE